MTELEEMLVENAQEAFSNYELMNFGYEIKTKFFGDFTLAEYSGEGDVEKILENIKTKYAELKEASKDNVEQFTELVMIVNHKSWFFYSEMEKIDCGGVHDDFKPLIELYKRVGTLYSELYYDARDYGYAHFKGDDLDYMFNTLD